MCNHEESFNGDCLGEHEEMENWTQTDEKLLTEKLKTKVLLTPQTPLRSTQYSLSLKTKKYKIKMMKKIFENQDKTILLQQIQQHLFNIQNTSTFSVKISFRDERNREIIFSRILICKYPQVGQQSERFTSKEVQR